MTVPTRYILAAFAFCAVALAQFIVPTDAAACGNADTAGKLRQLAENLSSEVARFRT